MALKMTRQELQAFLEAEFPQMATDFMVEDVSETEITVRCPVADCHLRPGGTISGPTIFSLADVTMYLALLARIGPQALAVTTSCAIDFMRKPQAGLDLIGVGRIHKLGRVLAVGDVFVYSAGGKDPVARAALTYSIPPKG